MSFFGKLFGTEKALAGIVDGVTNGLDMLVYTDEEKAGDAAKDRSEARQMVVQWMASTQGQNLARRLIALSITGTWLGLHLLTALIGSAAAFTNDVGVVTAEKLHEVVEIIKSVSSMEASPAVMLILAFYFAAPHMGDIAKAVTGKFTKSVNKG